MTMKEVTVITKGMTCASCERTISNALKKVDGIKDARADYATETTKITYDGSKVDMDKIKEAVESVGYDFGGEAKGGGKKGEKDGFKFPFFK